MKCAVLRLLATLGALNACAHDDAPKLGSAPRGAVTEVRWFGALHEIMHDQRTEARVRVADAARSPHTFGVGALAGLQGEITIVDGVAWIARANADGTASVSRSASRDTNEHAALLVVASVERWREVHVGEDVPFEQLDGYLARQIEQQGRSLSGPVPMVIVGPVAKLRWHVVDGKKLAAGADHAAHQRNGVTGQLPAAGHETTLVGFFSREHAGIFTHHGSFSHLHVVSAAPALSAHVDAVALRRGARLRLPEP